MKNKWIRLFACFVVLFLMGVGVFVFFGYIQTLDSWLQWVLDFALIALTWIFTYWLVFRKNPLVLSEEELREPVIERQDFSNSLTWSIYLAAVVIVLPSCVFVANATEMWLDGKSWEAIWAFHIKLIKRIGTSVTFWLLWFTMIAVCLRTMIHQARNKYIIDGDTLIVQENFIFKTEDEIRIPIACIDAVYTSSTWAPNPCLWINVNGVVRRCYSFPHSFELGKAILRHKHAIQ